MSFANRLENGKARFLPRFTSTDSAPCGAEVLPCAPEERESVWAEALSFASRRAFPVSVEVEDAASAERLVQKANRLRLSPALLSVRAPYALLKTLNTGEYRREAVVCPDDPLFAVAVDKSLNALAVDVSKLFRAENHSREGFVFNSFLQMTLKLDLRVTACGVETRGQAEYLTSVGCQQLEGPYFGEAVDADRLFMLCSFPVLPKPRKPKSDAAELWQMDSAQNLLFSDFVGAACLLDVTDGEITVLRANRQMADALGGVPVEKLLGASPVSYMSADDLRKFHLKIRTAVETDEKVETEICLRGIGSRQRFYARVKIRRLYSEEGRTLIYAVLNDETSEKEAEAFSQRSAERLLLLNEAARALLAVDDVSNSIPDVLERLMNYLGGDCAYLYLISDDRKTACRLYDLRAESAGDKPMPGLVSPIEAMEDWMAWFEDGRCVSIPDVQAYESKNPRRQSLRRVSTRSLIAMPFYENGQVTGWISVNNPSRNQERVEQLRALGDYIAAALRRQALTRRLREDNALLETVMRDTPGGFARVKNNADEKLELVYFNDHFCDIYHMTREEARTRLGGEGYLGVHPKDRDDLRRVMQETVQTGKPTNARLRFLRGDGKYAWIQAYYSVTTNDAGDRFVNIYYADPFWKRNVEEIRCNLMDNLPCGAGVFELSGGALRVLYINRSLMRMIGTHESGGSYADAMEYVHPEDQPRVWTVYGEMVEQKAGGNMAVRIRGRDGGYIRLSITGKAQITEDRRALIYAIFSEDTEQLLRISEEAERFALTANGRRVGIYDIERDELAIPNDAGDLEKIRPARETILRTNHMGERYRMALAELLESARRGEKQAKTILHLHVRADQWIWVNASLLTVFDADNRPRKAVVTIEDVTGVYEKELSYQHFRNQMNAIDNEKKFYCEVDIDELRLVRLEGSLIHLDPEACERDFRSYVLQMLAAKSDPKDRDALVRFFERERILRAFMEGRPQQTMEYRFAEIPGDYRWHRANVELIHDDFTGHSICTVFIQDIHADKIEELEIRSRAAFDGMTGLYNRATADERIAEVFSRKTGENCAVIIMDLNRFKSINDHLGHAVGDRAIREIARLILSEFSNDIAGRYGGDEFIIFERGANDPKAVEERVRRFVEKVAGIRLDENGSESVEVSVGVAMGNTAVDDYADLFVKADRALYVIKDLPMEYCAFYTPEMENKGYAAQKLSLRANRDGRYDERERRQLMSVLHEIFPLVVFVNVTRNAYDLMTYEGSGLQNARAEGTLTELAAFAAATSHPDDRESLAETLSREALLSAYTRGERALTHTGRQLLDGRYRLATTVAVLLDRRDDSDIHAIVFFRVNE